MTKHYAEPFAAAPLADKKNPTHYVNNKEFFAAIVDYRAKYLEAKALGLEKPRASNYIGECIYKIAYGLAQKHNFRNYSYIDDMASTAIESCITNLHMFDPEKSENPFAYFTQSCYYAFLHIIKREKKESSKKRRMILSGGFETFDSDSEDDEFNISINEYLQSFSSADHDEPEVHKKKEPKPGGLEGLFADE